MQNNQGQTGQSKSWGGEPRYNISKSELQQSIDQFDSFVIVGTVNGKRAVASTGSKDQARSLLNQHASDLMPQTT